MQFIQSSSAAFGVVITMVGTCVSAFLASVSANENSKRVELIHFSFNVIGAVIFTAMSGFSKTR